MTYVTANGRGLSRTRKMMMKKLLIYGRPVPLKMIANITDENGSYLRPPHRNANRAVLRAEADGIIAIDRSVFCRLYSLTPLGLALVRSWPAI
jgi:hypothetical protein